jgi:hypothetical protein
MVQRVPLRAGLLGAVLAGVLLWSGRSTLASDRALGASAERVAHAQRPSYPLSTCLVTGRVLRRESLVEVVIDGSLVRVADAAAAREVQADPTAWLARLREAVRGTEGPRYPLEVCPVDGRVLDDDRLEVVLGTRLVRVCCEHCSLATKAAPGPVLAALDDAYIQAGRASYPLDTCIVTGERLGEQTVEHLYGTTLVRLVNEEARVAFLAAPHRWLAELHRLADR